MLNQKETDGFANKSWRDWILTKAASKIFLSEAEGIQKATGVNLRKLWGMNMGENLAYIRRKDMKSLRDVPEPSGETVLVVGGGPSIAIHHQLETLRDSGFKGQIVTCDRMLIPLLKYGIVPNYVISVDGSPIILKFFKHKLVKANLDKIKILIHIATHPTVTRYLYRNKAQVHWFLAHQIFVSEEAVENSDAIVTIAMTATKHHIKGIQTLPAGGNVGVAAWAFAWVILHKKKIALIGFDMGYPEGTPLNKTYYYSSFIDATQKAYGKNGFAALSAQVPYEKHYNPAWKTYTYTDQVFRSYANIFHGFLDIMPKDVTTYSCVEGGALQHPKLKYLTLKQFLDENHD